MQDKFALSDTGRAADTRFIGRRILYYPCLSSTMDAARQAALAGVVEGTIVLAGEQTAGRGRLERGWLSPQGCLAFSLILYPEAHFLSGLVMVAALAVAETVTFLSPVAAGIKWPNDVMLNGKKISGILVEAGQREDLRRYAVIGVGLNVNLDPVLYPEIGDSATSLSAEVGRELSTAVVLRILLARLERWYEAYIAGEPVIDAWRASLTTIGKEVQVLAGGVQYEGVAEDVALDGALLLRLNSGQLCKMAAGDVTLKTPGVSAA